MFKEWVINHNPNLSWDFDNPSILAKQLSMMGAELDVKGIFCAMFALDDTGLTLEQNDKFLFDESMNM